MDVATETKTSATLVPVSALTSTFQLVVVPANIATSIPYRQYCFAYDSSDRRPPCTNMQQKTVSVLAEEMYPLTTTNTGHGHDSSVRGNRVREHQCGSALRSSLPSTPPSPGHRPAARFLSGKMLRARFASRSGTSCACSAGHSQQPRAAPHTRFSTEAGRSQQPSWQHVSPREPVVSCPNATASGKT